MSGRSCNQNPLWSDQGTGRKSKSTGNNLTSLPMCCLGVAWVKSIAQVCVCRTLSPRPDCLSIRTHAREVETLTLSERHFRLSTCRDSILILQVKTPYSSLLYLHIYNIYQYYTMIQCVPSRASQLFQSIWLSCLAALLAGILIHSSDCPSLLLEHPTSALHKCQPKKLPPKMCFEIQWVRFGHLGLWRQ